MDIEAAAKSLTGIEFDLSSVKGRNVWIAVAFNRPGMVHIQTTPTDRLVNDAVMPTINATEAPGSDERRRLYRQRCIEVAKSMNDRIVSDNKLFLFLASNGHLSKEAKTVIEALL